MDYASKTFISSTFWTEHSNEYIESYFTALDEVYEKILNVKMKFLALIIC